MIMFFFFQAEDGIRDIGVTGVQTCALPISRPPQEVHAAHRRLRRRPPPHRRRVRRARYLPLTASPQPRAERTADRKSTRLNSSHANISYAVFCLKKKKNKEVSKQTHDYNQ